ncbi:MAG: hypothetical protein NVSMB5_13500 [Candidatus Velthaea sp.]
MNESGVDLERLRVIAAGDMTVVRELIALALAEGRDLLDRLGSGDRATDPAYIAHALKGLYSTVGFVELAQAAADLQAVAGAGPPGYAAAFDRLRTLHADLETRRYDDESFLGKQCMWERRAYSPGVMRSIVSPGTAVWRSSTRRSTRSSSAVLRSSISKRI